MKQSQENKDFEGLDKLGSRVSQGSSSNIYETNYSKYLKQKAIDDEKSQSQVMNAEQPQQQQPNFEFDQIQALKDAKTDSEVKTDRDFADVNEISVTIEQSLTGPKNDSQAAPNNLTE